MQTQIINIQKRVAVGVMAVAILFGMTMSTGVAHAQAQNQSQFQGMSFAEIINALRQQVQQLQSQLPGANANAGASDDVSGESNSNDDDRIKIGDQVKTTANLNVRSGAGVQNGKVGELRQGGTATVVDGPRYVGNYQWWKLQYEQNGNQGNGKQGWVAGNWIAAVATTNNSDEGDNNVVENDDEASDDSQDDEASDGYQGDDANDDSQDDNANDGQDNQTNQNNNSNNQQASGSVAVVDLKVHLWKEGESYDELPRRLPATKRLRVDYDTENVSNCKLEMKYRNGEDSVSVNGSGKKIIDRVRAFPEKELKKVTLACDDSDGETIKDSIEFTYWLFKKDYQGYVDAQLIGEHSDIGRTNALARCLRLAENNVNKPVYCTWGDMLIYQHGDVNYVDSSTQVDSNADVYDNGQDANQDTGTTEDSGQTSQGNGQVQGASVTNYQAQLAAALVVLEDIVSSLR